MQRGSAFRWVVLFVLVLGSTALTFSNLIFSSRPVDVMAQFGVEQAQLTAVSAIGFLPGALFSIVLGNYFDRGSSKRIRLAGAILLIAGALFQTWRVFAGSYIELLIITFAAGTLFLPTQVLPAKLAEAWFEPREMGIAMGLWGAASCLGATFAFLVGGLFPSLQAALAACAVIYFIVAVLWLLFVKMPEGAEQEQNASVEASAPQGNVSVAAVMKSKYMWIIMICSGIAASTPILINSCLVNAFLERGLEPGLAALLGVVFSVVSFIGGTLCGIVASKLGRFNPVFLFICVGGGLMFPLAYLLPVGAPTFVCYIIAGLLFGGALGLCMARVGLLYMTGDFGPENNGIAGGMNNTVMGIMAFGLPTLATAILGGNYLHIYIFALVVLVIAGILGGVIFPELGEKGKIAQQMRSQQ